MGTYRVAITVVVAAGLAACQPAGLIDDAAKADLVAMLATKGVARPDAMRYANAIGPDDTADGYYLPEAVGGSIQQAAIVLDPVDEEGCRHIQYQVESRGRELVYNGVVCRPPGLLPGTLAWSHRGPLKDISPPATAAAPKPGRKAGSTSHGRR